MLQAGLFEGCSGRVHGFFGEATGDLLGALEKLVFVFGMGKDVKLVVQHGAERFLGHFFGFHALFMNLLEAF